MHRFYWAIVVGLLSLSPCLAQSKTGSTKSLTFEQHVRPIFKAMCFECHGEGKRLKGDLDLRLRRLLVQGGESGAGIVPGNVKKSLLVERLRKQEMPPGEKKLTPQQLKTLETWIAQGAKTLRPEPQKVKQGFLITEEERSHWAFQPIRRPSLPTVKNPWLLRSPIDAFILRRLQEQGVTFSPQAERTTLLRRIYFDLIGLPPSPEEMERFLNDTSPNAYEKVVDRLLNSPQYGERWGRHWLDVAGYADSEGYSSEDPERPYAYKYRDYVVRSFNQDKPWDQFIQEQLAGDELTSGKPLSSDRIEKLIATGFLRMAPDGTGGKGVNQGLARNQVVAETLKIVTTSLMGLSAGCAQCHNHRYDPIPQEDYYRLRAIFEPALNWKSWKSPASRRVSLYTTKNRQQAATIEKEAKKIDQERLKKQEAYIQRTFNKEVAKLPKSLQEKARLARKTPAKKRTKEQKQLLKEYPSLNVSAGSLYLYDRKAADDLKKYTARANKLRATKPKQDYLRALVETAGKLPTTYLFARGDHEQPKQALSPAGLSIFANQKLTSIPSNDKTLSTSGRRLAFARRLTDGRHPLTARVIVNRMWMHHFGRGLVNTPSDFGILGDRPTHPQLLDWLASEFMAGGWKLKRIHKLILLSTTYRQSSKRTAKLQEIDRENRLYGRMSIRRLEAEIVRDAILTVSGNLNHKQFGKPVPVRVDLTGQVVLGVDTRDGAGRPTKKVVPLNGEEYRRSLYVQVRRSMPLGVLETFDSPILSPNCEQRNASTVAPQSLLLMNSAFITKYAQLFAKRVSNDAGKDLRNQLELAWKLAFGVKPSTEDVQSAEQFIREQTSIFQSQRQKDPREKALASFCQALLSTNRFLYVD